MAAAPFQLAARASPARLGFPTSTRTLLRAAPRHSHLPSAHRALSCSQRQLASPRQHQTSRVAREPSRRWYSSQQEQQQQQQQQQKPKKDPNRVAFWPFLALIAVASGAWVMLVNQRKGELCSSCSSCLGWPQLGPAYQHDLACIVVLSEMGGWVAVDI